MAQSTKATRKKAASMVKATSYYKMVMCIMDISDMADDTDSASSSSMTNQCSMRVNSKMSSGMGTAHKCGPTAQAMLEIGTRANPHKAFTNGLMVQPSMALLRSLKCMVKVLSTCKTR